MRGAVFELVAVEVAGGGGVGRAVGAICATVFARGNGFARDGLVHDVRRVGTLGGIVEGGLGEGEGLGGVVVRGRHLWVGVGRVLGDGGGGGRGVCSDGQWLSCRWRSCGLLLLRWMRFYQWLMA